MAVLDALNWPVLKCPRLAGFEVSPEVTDQIEVDDVALSIRIRTTQPGFRVAGCPNEGCSEHFRIGLPDSD